MSGSMVKIRNLLVITLHIVVFVMRFHGDRQRWERSDIALCSRTRRTEANLSKNQSTMVFWPPLRFERDVCGQIVQIRVICQNSGHFLNSTLDRGFSEMALCQSTDKLPKQKNAPQSSCPSFNLSIRSTCQKRYAYMNQKA